MIAVLIATPAVAAEIVGIDHVPIAVRDLERSATRYRNLGFTLKPGRPHADGIRNEHVKFADGTEIELITAVDAVDGLTTEYVRHLAQGDGPAFVAFYTPDLDAAARRLAGAGRSYRRASGLLTFPEGDRLRYIFFGGRNTSPTDRPEHFRHANGAEGLIGVWLAGDDLSVERELFRGLGARFEDAGVHVPDAVRATVARFAEGEVVLLPGSRRIVDGRRIVGVTLRVRSLDDLRAVLAGSSPAPTVVETEAGRSIFLPPEVADGLWLEFREQGTL